MASSDRARIRVFVDAEALRRASAMVGAEYAKRTARDRAFSFVALGFAFLCVAAYASGSVETFAAANAVLGPFVAAESYRRHAWGPLLLNVAFTLVGAATLLGWI